MSAQHALRKSTDYIAVHCSASVPDPGTDAKTIDRWHRQRGFNGIGYHMVVKTDGTVQPGREIDTVGAHVQGYNHNSIGICMVGGVDANGPTGKPENNFSEAQFDSLEIILRMLKQSFPKATVQGHRDFPGVKKACPSFDVKAWVISKGIK